MLIAVSGLKGVSIEASDGLLGTVGDFLFDDTTWKVRWLVVDTGSWLNERKVLIHPSAIVKADSEWRTIPVKLTRAQVEGSPGILTDRPVSRQMESDMYQYYGSDPYWGGGNFASGAMASPLSLRPPPDMVDRNHPQGENYGDGEGEGDAHLRSTTAINGYHVLATDGKIGHLENIFIDDASWDIRYLTVDTRNWWPGQHVLLSPQSVRQISWSDRQIALNITRDQVKTSPPWDPVKMIDSAYEHGLRHHYGWPRFGY